MESTNKIMRKRFNLNAVASSYNYKEHKIAHQKAAEENHKHFIEIIAKQEITIKRQAYVRVFGELIPVSPEEIQEIQDTVTIIYK